VLIEADTIRRALAKVAACEHCSIDAEIPFDWILDRVLGRSGANTDYVMSEPAKCPGCRREINEKTLILPGEI